MKLALILGAAILLIAPLGRAQTVQEWKLDLTQYGLAKSNCPWYPGRVEFLDDDHLVVGAPVAYACDKRSWQKPSETRITELDLQGHELATVRRSDVVKLVAGPIGHIAVCTGDHFELLSHDLQIARSITVSGEGQSKTCPLSGGLSPSRTAIVIAGPARSQFRLYEGSSNDPIAEVTTSKGQSVRAIADDGILVCEEEKQQCEIVGARGAARSFVMPLLYGETGYYIVGLVAPDRLLFAGFNGKSLYAETTAGERIAMGDVAKIRPPFIDSSGAEMSAAEPRRVLYHIGGCLLGDFDDCYGVVIRNFAVFDTQTSRMLFRHSYAPEADLKISPSGRVVMEQNGAEVRLFRLP